MPPNTKDVNLHKDVEGAKSTAIREIFVINLPDSSDLKTKAWEFEDALNEIGYGRVQLQLLVLGSLILMTVFGETMGISFLIPAAQCDLDLSTSDKGLLSGMAFFGIMLSSYFWGYLGDTQGRRLVILVCLLFSTVFTLISAFVKSFTVFVICRFLTGIFVAGYNGTLYAYIGEFNSNKNRAATLSWVSSSIAVASIYLPLSALWILSYDWRFDLYDGYEFRPWRLLLFMYCAPGIIGGLWLWFLPESPKYLLTQNRNDEAMEVIRWVYRKNKGKRNHDDLRIGKLVSEASEVCGKEYTGLKAILMSMANQILPLCKPPFARYFFACCFLHFGTFSVAGGMALFLPETLNRLSIAKAEQSGDLQICDVFPMYYGANDTNVADYACNDSVNPSVFVDTTAIGVGFLIGFVTLSLSIKFLGRRKVFVFTLFTSCIAGVSATFVSSHYLIVIFYCLFILCCGMNVTVINSAACDLFPTHLRATSLCVSMLFGRLGSTVSTNLIGYLLERNCELTYYMFSSIVLLCLAVSFIIPSRPVTNENNKVEK